MEEYTKKGMSTDQNTYVSEKWGELKFVPAASRFFADTCRHCLLYRPVAGLCSDPRALCASCERKDKKYGYFVKSE